MAWQRHVRKGIFDLRWNSSISCSFYCIHLLLWFFDFSVSRSYASFLLHRLQFHVSGSEIQATGEEIVQYSSSITNFWRWNPVSEPKASLLEPTEILLLWNKQLNTFSSEWGHELVRFKLFCTYTSFLIVDRIYLINFRSVSKMN